MKYASLIKGLIFRRRMPLFVTYRITNRCNYHCAYCDSVKHKTQEMSFPQISGMIDEFSRMGMIKLGITGGEPLLREDIGEIIDYARSHNIMVSLNSNGAFVPERIGNLKNLNILFISIDGSEKTHEKTRGKASFTAALKAIDTAMKAGIEVWTLTVLTRHNIRDLDNLIQILPHQGIRMLFQPVECWDMHSGKVNDLLPIPEEYHAAIDKLLELKRKTDLIGTSRSYLKLLRSWPNYPADMSCKVGKFTCNVLPDGEVISCTIIPQKEPNNGLVLGFAEAFRRLETPRCKGCFMNCYHEPNFICQLKSDALLNAAHFLSQKRKME